MCNGNVNLEEDDKILIFLVFEFSAQYTVCEFEFRFFFSVLSCECVECIEWKGISFVAKTLYRTGVAKTGLMESLALDCGMTALSRAVMRGDIEIVKILLENGADPYVENDLGMNAFSICDRFGPFPSVKEVLRKHGTNKPVRRVTELLKIFSGAISPPSSL